MRRFGATLMDTRELEKIATGKNISKDEFKQSFKTVQNSGGYTSGSIFSSNYSDAELDNIFSKFDVNGDGQIDGQDNIYDENFSEDVMSQEDLNLLVSELNEMFNSINPFGLQGINPSGMSDSTYDSSGGGGGGNGGVTGDNYGADEQQVQAQNDKSYSNMSVDELKSELKTAQDGLSENQNALNGVIDGSNSELSGLKEDIDKKQEEYQKKLSEVAPELNNQYEQAKSDLDTHKQTISNTQVQINTTQATVDSLTAEIGSLDGQISSYESAVSNLKAQEGKENAPENLSSKISELEAQTPQKEQALEAIQGEIDKLNNEDLNNLKEALTTAQSEYDSKKSSLQTEAKQAIDTAKANVDKIQTELNTKQAQDIKNQGNLDSAKGLYKSMGLEEQGLSFENFNFMFEGYNNLEDKGSGRISIVDEKNHNCFVIDMNSKKLLGKYRVSTGHKQNDIDKANQANSYRATPGGWLKVGTTHYGKRYNGNAMNLEGLENCNDNTMSRGVIAHHIGYGIGYNTWGCLGFKESVSTIKNNIMPTGQMVFVIKEGMIGADSKYRKQSKYYT